MTTEDGIPKSPSKKAYPRNHLSSQFDDTVWTEHIDEDGEVWHSGESLKTTLVAWERQQRDLEGSRHPLTEAEILFRNHPISRLNKLLWHGMITPEEHEEQIKPYLDDF